MAMSGMQIMSMSSGSQMPANSSSWFDMPEDPSEGPKSPLSKDYTSKS